MNHRVSRSLTVFLAASTLAACADPPLDDDGHDAASQRAPAAAPASAPPSTLGHFAPDEVIVKLHDAYDGSGPLMLGGRRLVPIQQLPSGTWHMRIDDTRRAQRDDRVAAASETLAAIDEVRADAAVAYAHENRAFELSLVPNDPEAQLSPPGRQAWSHSQINLYGAWDVTTGSTAVRIALIDSGRRNHPDLQNRWGAGWDFIWNDSDPTDDPPSHPYDIDWAHGIHVAGIAGGRANNGIGGAGVCWNCPILPLRVTPLLRDDLFNPIGIAYITEIENAIAWAAGPDGGPRRAEVINMSLNDPDSADCNAVEFNGVRTQISRAISRGVVVVSSAGNIAAGTPTTAARVPATCPGVISVMASGPGGTVPAYSARGAGVDLVAPGGGIDYQTHYGEGVGCPEPIFGSGTNGVFSPWSYRLLANPAQDAHCYRHLSGTSMSAPHVAGVVALMRSVNASLTPAQIEQYLLATARPGAITCPTPGACGAGLLDAHAAVLAARDGLAPDIDVAPASLAFPPTRITTVSAPQTLTVQNTGAGALNATVVAPTQLTLACASGGCTCASATSCTVNASPSAQATLHVRFAPTVAGPFSSNLTITSNDPDENPRTVPVTGTATYSAASVSPTSIDFGSVQVGTLSSTQVVVVSSTGTAAFTITGLGATGNVGHFTVTPPSAFPITVAPGASAQFAVRCAPTSPGPKQMTLQLPSNANIPGPPVQVSCQGVAPPDIDVTPASLAFPPTRVTTVSAPQTLTVRNTGAGALSAIVTAPKQVTLACASGGCTCANTKTCTVNASPSAQATLHVRYAPTTSGPFASSLTVTSNDPDENPRTVPVTGTGTYSQASISPHTMHFGWVAVGATSNVQWAQIANAGTAPLTITGLGATGDLAHYEITPPGPFPITVVPGAAAQFAVRCIPTSSGRKKLTLRLTNDANIQAAPVDVRCDGVLPDARLVVASPGPDFGLIQVGTTASRAVHVLNVSEGSTQLEFTLQRPAAPFDLTCTSGCTCTPLSCSGTVTSGGPSATLALTYAPTELGTHAATLAFVSNSPTLPHASIETSGSGGTAVMTVIDPADGVVVLRAGALSQKATIQNTGNLPLRLDGWQIDPSAPMADRFEVSPSTTVWIEPDGVHSWELTCRPSWRTGVYSAALVVDSNLGQQTPVIATCYMGPLDEIPPPGIPLPPPATM